MCFSVRAAVATRFARTGANPATGTTIPAGPRHRPYGRFPASRHGKEVWLWKKISIRRGRVRECPDSPSCSVSPALNRVRARWRRSSDRERDCGHAGPLRAVFIEVGRVPMFRRCALDCCGRRFLDKLGMTRLHGCVNLPANCSRPASSFAGTAKRAG